MIVLVTGAAGFIGFHTARALLDSGAQVIGLDNLNDYYDTRLKQARLAQLAHPGFLFHQVDIADREAIDAILAGHPGITHLVHLAAQAGVRYSMENPYAYIRSNVMGHVVLLEAARRLRRLQHFVYASSSSVYGLNPCLPFDEDARVDRPSSLYAATKRADELISHAYTHLYALPQTGLRFFTVYGPWGRPDMAYYSFASAIRSGRPVTLYEGDPKRDFTYIDDVVAGLLGVIQRPPATTEARILNLGNHRTEPVARMIALLEQGLQRRAIIQMKPRPAADVVETWARNDRLHALTGYAPSTPLDVGIGRFVAWFQSYAGAC